MHLKIIMQKTWRLSAVWWSPRIAQADRLLKHPRNNVVLVPSRKSSSCTVTELFNTKSFLSSTYRSEVQLRVCITSTFCWKNAHCSNRFKNNMRKNWIWLGVDRWLLGEWAHVPNNQNGDIIFKTPYLCRVEQNLIQRRDFKNYSYKSITILVNCIV